MSPPCSPRLEAAWQIGPCTGHIGQGFCSQEEACGLKGASFGGKQVPTLRSPCLEEGSDSGFPGLLSSLPCTGLKGPEDIQEVYSGHTGKHTLRVTPRCLQMSHHLAKSPSAGKFCCLPACVSCWPVSPLQGEPTFCFIPVPPNFTPTPLAQGLAQGEQKGVWMDE